MTHPSSPPAPMTAERYSIERIRRAQILEPVGAQQFAQHTYASDIRALLEQHDALTARVAELERERQYTCEQHRDEVRKGERCVWCELAAARGAFDLSESERQRLAGRINATEARKVEDGDVQDAVDWLRDRAECSSIMLDPAPMGPIADLLTRLSAALKEAERLLSHRTKDMQRWIDHHDARADAAEAKLETARRDALEEAATHVERAASVPSAGVMRFPMLEIVRQIRALQTKDTTP